MQADVAWQTFLRLPSEAQQSVADYIAFLSQRTAEKTTPLTETAPTTKRFAWEDGGLVVGDSHRSLTDELRRQRDENHVD